MTPTCIRCHEPSPRRVRAMCAHCYGKCLRAGTHLDYPRVTRTQDELLDDYATVRARGNYTQREIAMQLGMSYKTLTRALTRARSAGKQVAA